MSQGNLYRDNLATTMHESPRESFAWFVWLVVGAIIGCLVSDVWDMHQDRLERAERFRQEGFIHQGDGVWVRDRPGERTVLTENYRASAESQSGGHRSQPTAGAR